MGQEDMPLSLERNGCITTNGGTLCRMQVKCWHWWQGELTTDIIIAYSLLPTIWSGA